MGTEQTKKTPAAWKRRQCANISVLRLHSINIYTTELLFYLFIYTYFIRFFIYFIFIYSSWLYSIFHSICFIYWFLLTLSDFVKILISLEFEHLWSQPCWFTLQQWRAGKCSLVRYFIHCHTYQSSDFHWYTLLGTKWQHPGSCFGDFEMPIYLTNRMKNRVTKMNAVYIKLYNSIFIDLQGH